jgi:outer membrane protein OmpA-like peptidoglycan-associated protein
MQKLGQQRAEAIQTALLTDTGLAPERVFLAAEGKVAPNEQQVRFELAVK